MKAIAACQTREIAQRPLTSAANTKLVKQNLVKRLGEPRFDPLLKGFSDRNCSKVA